MTTPIGLALIGVGRWGPNLLRNLQHNGRSQVIWVVDKNPVRLDEVKSRFPHMAVGQDPAEALRDPRVQGVVIATPASTHHELAHGALVAGKHCLVEKPLTNSSTQASELAELADRSGLVLAVGHVFLHNPAVRHVRRLLEADSLGEVRYIAMTRTNLGPLNIDVNVVWDLATHDISIANYWLDDVPQAVSARGGCWIRADREDTVFATLIYSHQRMVHLSISWLSPRKVRDVVVVGSRRMLTFDDLDTREPIRVHDKRIIADDPFEVVDSYANFRASICDGDITIPPVSGGEPLQLECDNFVASITDGAKPLADAASAIPVLRTVEAINRSISKGGCEEALL